MKKIIFFITTLIVTLNMVGQSLPKGFGRYRRPIVSTTSSNPLLDQVVSNGIFVINQSYQLEDSVGNFFGVEGKKEFGTDINIAFMVKNGYLLLERTKSPWNYNPSFRKFKKRYNPQLFPTQYAELAEKASYDSIPYNESQLITIFPQEIYAMPTNIFFNDGFTTGHSAGKIKGYIIWITKPEQKDLKEDTKLNIVSIPMDLTEESDRSRIYEVSPLETQDEILGMMYLVPKNTGVGRLEFILHGVGISNDGYWYLVCPFTDLGDVFNSSAPVVNEEPDVVLTPNRN